MTDPEKDDDLEKLIDELKRAYLGRSDYEHYERVFSELYALARRLAHGESLVPAALFKEALLRLNRSKYRAKDASHLRDLLAYAMRSALLDYYRSSERHSGSLEEPIDGPAPRLVDADIAPDSIALVEALEDLGKLSAEQLSVAELRLYAGYTLPETADTLGLSVATVDRRWRAAKAYLKSRLG